MVPAGINPSGRSTAYVTIRHAGYDMQRSALTPFVMAGLVPAIHAFLFG